jgi:hypothetical protein
MDETLVWNIEHDIEHGAAETFQTPAPISATSFLDPRSQIILRKIFARAFEHHLERMRSAAHAAE